MVYYYTSGNVKMMRNILIDYGTITSDMSAYEYMKAYIEKCPDTIDDSKLSWISETFLDIQKHGQLLKEVASHMSEELKEQDQDYFMIILHAVTFQITPNDMHFLYKCMYNLSKPLLNTFTKFLSNNEVLTFITQIAHSIYDTNYTTEKIINPLFTWQPYISEMAHSYAEYVNKIESRKVKPPTIPIQLNVLNRKNTDESPLVAQTCTLPPVTPPNSVRTKKRMLSKSTIDRKLKQIHEKNKHKAIQLLNDVKHKHFHYAQPKSEKYYKTVSNIKYELENNFTKPYIKPKTTLSVNSTLPPIKETVANLRRTNKRIQLAQEEEVQWLQNLITTCQNTAQIDEQNERERQIKEKERLLDIERKHLMGQISYEQAVISKRQLKDDNKKKYEEFLKEKDVWNQEIENWKKTQIEKNRKQVEKLSLLELDILQAKNGIAAKKKEKALKLKKESELILANALKVKQEELDKRVNMIKEIKILSMIAKKARLPKILDLTETSGIGLLCEMSIAELQERLSVLKIGLSEELEKKKQLIMQENMAIKQEVEETKVSIKNYMTERAAIRIQKKLLKTTIGNTSSQEIDDLKKILEEKKKLRIQLSG